MMARVCDRCGDTGAAAFGLWRTDAEPSTGTGASFRADLCPACVADLAVEAKPEKRTLAAAPWGAGKLRAPEACENCGGLIGAGGKLTICFGVDRLGRPLRDCQFFSVWLCHGCVQKSMPGLKAAAGRATQ